MEAALCTELPVKSDKHMSKHAQSPLLTHDLHHSVSQEGSTALQVAKAFDVQRPHVSGGIAVGHPLCQIPDEQTELPLTDQDFNKHALSRPNKPVVDCCSNQFQVVTGAGICSYTYLPAPPAKVRPEEFIPART